MSVEMGAQIWALRPMLQSDAATTFERIAAAGYTHVEPAGLDLASGRIQDFSSHELKSLTRAAGLHMISAHFYHDLQTAPKACEIAAKLGLRQIVHAFFKDDLAPSIEAYQRAAAGLNEMGAIAKSFDLQLAYHNHAHEFEQIQNKVLFDILLEETDADLVGFQPDLGWMVYAGQDPNNYFARYPGRFASWHIRDIDKSREKSTTIGEGTVDFPAIFAEKEKAGLKYAIVEMASSTENPLEKIEKSYKNISFWI
ncbi:sugar phosphate isomerase/epimerase [Niabella insulamsoli]|uniref:sugar phosphate isomerase/epimerase family protein n=1 Tax=Niabella insulamsoli TaxID=3144874 RepID=UPI0031FBF225